MELFLHTYENKILHNPHFHVTEYYFYIRLLLVCFFIARLCERFYFRFQKNQNMAFLKLFFYIYFLYMAF